MEVATSGGAEQAPADTGPLSFSQAVQELVKERREQDTPAIEQTNRAPNGQFTKRDEEESAPAVEQDAEPQETAPISEEESDEPAELPPIEPPHSWNATEKERFASLPRETQEYLAAREAERDAELRRNQNAAAEREKALEAQRQAVEQERHRAEQATTQALQIVQAEYLKDFADIKTREDANKLAVDDPFRWAQWKQKVDDLQILQVQVQQQQQQRQQLEAHRFTEYAKAEDEKFAKQYPETQDPEKGPEITKKVTRYLTDVLGFSANDIMHRYQSDPGFRNSATQKLIYDAMRFHEAQQKAKSVSAAPKPPVQRPGTGQVQRATTAQTQIKALEKQFASATRVSEQMRIQAEILKLERQTKQ